MNEVIIMQSLHPKIHDILRFQKCQKKCYVSTLGHKVVAVQHPDRSNPHI